MKKKKFLLLFFAYAPMFSNTHHPSKHTHVTVTSKKRGRGREGGREGERGREGGLTEKKKIYL
jgi:hypothetical protein